MTIKECAIKYNISETTIRNWYKLKYIKNISNIESSEIENIKKLKKKSALNKKDSLEQSIPKSYLHSQSSIDTIENLLSFKNKYDISLQTLLYYVIKKFLKNKFTNEIDYELHQVLGNISLFSKKISNAFDNLTLNFSENDDFIGGLYMSLMSVGNRSTRGVYYTPSDVVDLAIEKINNLEKLDKIYDPSCGSGNFLIKIFNKLSNNFNEHEIIKKLYGSDIDPIATLLCKINLYYLTKSVKFSDINISNTDFLLNTPNIKFDLIIGNPPWGAKYSKTYSKDLLEKYSSKLSKYDSFALFTHVSLNILKKIGTIIFILPTSITNIEKHEEIRKEILNYTPEIIILGNKFSEVYTNTILLKIINSKSNLIKINDVEYNKEIVRKNPYTSFLVPSDNISSSILEKIKNYKSYYLDNATYALGIVTGNNEKFLKEVQTNNYEPIITGKNLQKYYINTNSINKFILFTPNELQQVAPENLYRSKHKILYKFIGNKLIFSYDNKGILSLNSANLIVLPEELDGYYITAILNSRITQLYFDEYYNTHKVLKNHIQSFHIFDFDDLIKEKISKLSRKIVSKDTFQKHFEDIEYLIYTNLFLSDKEITYLKKME